MKLFSLLLSILLSLFQITVPLQASDEIRTISIESKVNIDTYIKYLEEFGYCVIPRLFSTAETEKLYKQVWNEFVEKAWPNCKMEDRSNWKDTFPIHDKYGIFVGPAGHSQALWDIRQDPRIVEVFAKLWNTHDLVVSMDGLSLMCPPEIRRWSFEPWPHVDQTIPKCQNAIVYNKSPPVDFVSESLLKTNPYNVQGQFLLEDSFEGDGGFYCIPKSHLKFNEFASQLKEEPTVECWQYNNQFLMDFFSNRKDESGHAYCMKHVTAPRGSLILWDSRTVHWNQYPSENRPCHENPRVRMVSYLLYLPKSRLTDEAKAIRKECFDKKMSTTGAIPTSWTELRYSKDLIKPEFMQYLEDPNYTPPKINLSDLGKSLLGF